MDKSRVNLGMVLRFCNTVLPDRKLLISLRPDHCAQNKLASLELGRYEEEYLAMFI